MTHILLFYTLVTSPLYISSIISVTSPSYISTTCLFLFSISLCYLPKDPIILFFFKQKFASFLIYSKINFQIVNIVSLALPGSCTYFKWIGHKVFIFVKLWIQYQISDYIICMQTPNSFTSR